MGCPGIIMAIPSKKTSGTWDLGFIEVKGHVHHHFPPKPFAGWCFLLYNIYIIIIIYIYLWLVVATPLKNMKVS
jgi:hypothetical protein